MPILAASLSLIGSLIGFVWEILWALFEPFLVLGIALACAGGGAFLAFTIIAAEPSGTKPRIKAKKATRITRAKKVALTNSPLFLACLQKIADSEIDSLYVNSHMACFNFRGNNIGEESVLDFVKAGYEPIDEARVPQYYEQLIAAAKNLPNVVSVSQKTFSHSPASYLIVNGRYDMPGDNLPMLEFKYRVVNTKKLKSFSVK